MALTIQPLLVSRNTAQKHIFAHTLHMLFQLFRDFLNFIAKAEVIAKKLSNFCVLVIAAESFGGDGVGGVDVDVCSGVAVCAPACLCSAGDHVGEDV